MKRFIIIILILLCITSIIGAFWFVLGPLPVKTLNNDLNLVTKSISIISNRNSQQIKKSSAIHK